MESYWTIQLSPKPFDYDRMRCSQKTPINPNQRSSMPINIISYIFHDDVKPDVYRCKCNVSEAYYTLSSSWRGLSLLIS